jgi:hypothetical protein
MKAPLTGAFVLRKSVHARGALMASKEKARRSENAGSKQKSVKSVIENSDLRTGPQPRASSLAQRAGLNPEQLTPGDLPQLQHLVGNRAVLSALQPKLTAPTRIQRQSPAQATETPTLPSADELTTRIARCIGIWETNRGKDDPAPKESTLDTAAGVHASMATIEQATMPYAITALKGHKTLRDKATPPLTMKELNDAEARCVAVSTLLSSVATASAASTKPDDFIKDNAAAITATGLSNDDVKTMFSAVSLKSTIDTLHADVTAKKKTTKEAVDTIADADRLGMGEGSLKAYIDKPGKWGENRAAWQRKAVAAMADEVGARIQAVAVSESGTALATPVIKQRVDAQLAKDPVPDEETLVKAVAQQNNPGEKNYGENVWKNYQRLYPKETTSK